MNMTSQIEMMGDLRLTQGNNMSLDLVQPPPAPFQTSHVPQILDFGSANAADENSTGRKIRFEEVYGNIEVGSADDTLFIRAERIRFSLPPEIPTFTKLLKPSHVSKAYRMGFPCWFCSTYLPKEDGPVVLVGDNEKEYTTQYTEYKGGLNGGWKRFVLDHKLAAGDAVVFHNIRPSTFKVFMVRTSDLAKVDEVLSLPNLENSTPVSGTYEVGSSSTGTSQMEVDTPATNPLELPFSNINSAVSAGFPDLPEFKTDLHSELPDHLIAKYYELCFKEQVYLHHRLIGKYNSTFIDGIIGEVVNTSNEMRCSSLCTPREQFILWDQKLAGFDALGMEVGFLEMRLQRLAGLALNATRESELKRMMEARCERQHLEAEVTKMKLTILKLDAEIEALEEKDKADRQIYLHEARG